MPAETDGADPALRHEHALSIDKYEKKAVDATEKLQNKAHDATGHDKEEKKPAGGYDATPVKKAEAGYTIKITFHSAANLPFADLSMTSDPYIYAVLKTDLPKRHKQDPDLSLRTPTVHRNVDPVWNTEWTIAHVPASGFNLKMRLYDEDPADHDDRLGNVYVNVNRIDESWTGFTEQKLDVKKRAGSKRAYTLRGCMSLVSHIKMEGTVTVSIENLGRSEGDGGRAYTIGPLMWKQHHSPLIGRITGIKDDKDEKGTAKYNFQAIQLQLRGPVPAPLYHRYVEFRPFVAGMFTSHTIKGRVLNHALHHQHARIYNYDTSTKYGSFEKPCPDMTNKFLEFVHYDQGGRIFTYIITLDAQMRFTETGKEFGVDLLSKHTMHSDVSSYIAFSGEFFIRRLKHPRKDQSLSPDPSTEAEPPAPEPSENKPGRENEADKDQDTSSANRPQSSSVGSSSKQGLQSPLLSPENEKRNHSFFRRKSGEQAAAKASNSQPNPQDSSKEASNFELIIDNDSGTYRPNAKFLPELKKFLAANFSGLHVVTLDCQKDEEKMKKLKDEQRERKKKEGKQITYMQNSSMSSISSSDEEELERRANHTENARLKGKAQHEWNKLKHIGHDDGENDEKSQAVAKSEDRAVASHDETDLTNSQKDGPTDRHTADSFNQKAARANATSSVHEKHSISTDADHQSFQTAFTDDHLHEQFVTPKPSLGDGGLKKFGDDGGRTPKASEQNPLSYVHHAVTSEAR